MRVFVLAIATLVILHGYVESKNVTTPVEGKSTTTTTTTKASVFRGRRTTTKSTEAAGSTSTANAAKTTAGTKAPTGTTKQAGSDREARGKRTLEFGNYGNYNFIPSVPAHTAQRRVSHAYQDPGQYSQFQGNYIQPQYAYQTHHQSAGAPYQGFDADSTNSIGSFQSLPPVVHPHYIEPPEPIIEIIIKESNESLPLEAQALLPKQKKKKEEVQVFYVKYHKDETNGQLVLDDPLPAIKPIPDESEEEEDPSQEPIVVTVPPPIKTTTLRAVINPDSEKYHSNSGIRISFGVEDKHQGGHQISESESESVAQPIVALPQHAADHQRAKSDVFFQQHQQFVQQQHDRSVRQHYQPQPPPQQHQPQHQQQQVAQLHHQQYPQHQPQYQQHHHQPQPQPQQYRAQPPPPQPQQPLPQAHHPQQYQQQAHYQPHPQQQHYQPQPQPQPQPQRVVYNQPLPPQPQPQPQPQYQYRAQFAQPQQQQQYYSQQAPVQPRPQQVRFPPPQQQSQPQPQQAYYQPQPQPPVAPPQLPPPQFQRVQEYQQPKPIPIPLHNINQQPPLRQQYTPQQPTQQPQPQFNQPFNNFYKPQPQSQPQPTPQQQPQFRKPVPQSPATQQQPPFVSQRPAQAPQTASFQSERPNVGLRGSFFDASTRPVQGGLVQQAAPNLGPTRAPEHHHHSGPTHSGLTDTDHLANLKHVLPAGGELIASVSKYEKHITETVGGGSGGTGGNAQQRVPASPSNRPPFYNIQPSQELISHSVEPTIENVAPQNIGPLATNIGPLPTPQKYVSQQAAQVIPNSQPHNFAVDPRFNANSFGVEGLGGSTPSTVGTTRTTYSPTFSTTPRTSTVQRYTAPPTVPTTRPPTPSPTAPPTSRSAAEEAAANEKKQKALFDLPDEVPEDLRAQLLSSGILENADISVLDYDKLGETALENLPPEHLANFFNAGGGSQLAGSSNVLSVVRPNGDKLADKFITQNHEVKGKRDERDRYEVVRGQGEYAGRGADEDSDQPTIVTMPERQNVDLKVVRFDSSNQKNVTDRYIKHDSTILPSVDVTSEQEVDQPPTESSDPVFNRYLPLKINGAQFPIPDVVELRGRRIASVVVLAPVDGGSPQAARSGESASEEGSTGSFLIHAEDEGNADDQQQEQPQQQSRFERDVLLDSQRIKFIAGEALKQLIKKPSRENFRRWLDREGKTEVDLQSVVLLVTRNDENEQEIFMYDIATKGVTHLSGELSAAFVQVAEDNAKTQNFDEVSSIVDTGIVEQMETKASQESAVDYGLTSSEEQDDQQQAEASEQEAIYVYPENYRGLEVSSGYSNIKK